MLLRGRTDGEHRVKRLTERSITLSHPPIQQVMNNYSRPFSIQSTIKIQISIYLWHPALDDQFTRYQMKQDTYRPNLLRISPRAYTTSSPSS